MLYNDPNPNNPPLGFDKEAFKYAIGMIESAGGKYLSNKTSSAAGKYHFLYNLISRDPDLKGISKREFINDPELQEKIMDKALAGKLKGFSAYGVDYAKKLKREYGSKLRLGELAALTHFLGPGNVRKYLSNPDTFKVPGTNLSAQSYLDKYNKFSSKFQPKPQLKKENVDTGVVQGPYIPKNPVAENPGRARAAIESQPKPNNSNVITLGDKDFREADRENRVGMIDIQDQNISRPRPESPVSMQSLLSYIPNSTDNEMAKGGMLKRKDGSYSKRGLWDNIRANKGSGKKPTKEMLRQERRIKNEKAHGGHVPQASGANELVTMFEAGGTHEQNPIGGIPQGIGSNGKPNLVEEGETKWNDYIFSNRIKL